MHRADDSLTPEVALGLGCLGQSGDGMLGASVELFLHYCLRQMIFVGLSLLGFHVVLWCLLFGSREFVWKRKGQREENGCLLAHGDCEMRPFVRRFADAKAWSGLRWADVSSYGMCLSTGLGESMCHLRIRDRGVLLWKRESVFHNSMNPIYHARANSKPRSLIMIRSEDE